MYKTNYHFSFTIGSCACCWCVHRRLDGTALIAEIIFIFAISLGVASITVWACRINLQLSFLYTTVHSGIMQISDLPVLLVNSVLVKSYAHIALYRNDAAIYRYYGPIYRYYRTIAYRLNDCANCTT